MARTRLCEVLYYGKVYFSCNNIIRKHKVYVNKLVSRPLFDLARNPIFAFSEKGNCNSRVHHEMRLVHASGTGVISRNMAMRM